MPVRWQGDQLFISLTPGGQEGCGAIERGKQVVHACSAAADGALFVAACTADRVAFFIAHAAGEALRVKRAGVWSLPEASQQSAAPQRLLRLSLSHDARYTLAVTGTNAYILSRGSGAYEGASPSSGSAPEFVSFCPTEAPQASRAAAASGVARGSPAALLEARWWSPHLHGSAASFALAGLGAQLDSGGATSTAVRSYSEGSAVGASNYPAILLVVDASGWCEVWRETDPWCAPTFTRCLSIQVAEPLSTAPAPQQLPDGVPRRSGPSPCGCSDGATSGTPTSSATAVGVPCSSSTYCTHASASWVQRRVVHDRLHWMHGQEEEGGSQHQQLQPQQRLRYLSPSSAEHGSGAAGGASGSDSSAAGGEGILSLPPLPHTVSVSSLAAAVAASVAASSNGASSTKTDNTGISAPLPKSFMQHTAISVQELSSQVSLSSGSGKAGEAEVAPPPASAAAPVPVWPTTGHWRETEIRSRPRAGSLVRSTSSASFRVVDMPTEGGEAVAAPAAAPAAATAPSTASSHTTQDHVPTALLLSDSPSGAQSMHTEYFLVSECLTRIRRCVHALESIPGADDKSSTAPAAVEVARDCSIRLTLWRVAGVRDVPQRHFSVTKCKVVEVPLAGLGALAAIAAAPAATSCRVSGAVSDVLYRSGGQAVPTLLKLGDEKGARGSGGGAGGRGRRQQAVSADTGSTDGTCAWMAGLPDATAAVTCCGGGVDALDTFRSIAGQEAVWAAVASSAEEADPALAALHSGAGQLQHPSSPALAPMTPLPEGSSVADGGATSASARASLGSPLSTRHGLGSSSSSASAGAGAASAASKLRSRAASALATAVTLDVSAGDWGDPYRLLADGSSRAVHRVRWWFDGRADEPASMPSESKAGSTASETSGEAATVVPSETPAEGAATGATTSASPPPAPAEEPASCGPTSSTDNSWDVFHRVPARTGARGACVPLRASEPPQGTRLLLETGAGTGVDVVIDWEAGAVQALGTVKLHTQANGVVSPAVTAPVAVSAWEPTPLPPLSVALEPPAPTTQPQAAPHPCLPEGSSSKAGAATGTSALASEALPQHHPAFLLSCLRNGTPAVVSTLLAHLSHSLLRAVAWRKVLRAATAREDARATERRKAKLAALIKSDRGASSHALPSLMTDSDTCSLRAQWDDTAVLREEGWWINDEDESGAGVQAGEAALMKVAVAPLPASYLLSVAGASSSAASASKPSSTSSSFAASLFSSEALTSSSSSSAPIIPEEVEAADNAAAEDATDPPEWLLGPEAEEGASSGAASCGPYPLRVLRKWYGCPALHEGVHPTPAALVGQADKWDPEATSTDSSTASSSYRPRLTGPLLAALASHLPNASIVGLGPGDNLLLLAVIETMRALYGSQRSEAAALDAAGFQFLLSVKLFQVSRRCLSPADRPAGLAWSDCAWALQSDSQDALFRLCVPASLTWADMQALRIPLWLRSDDQLAEAVTRVATTQFQRSEHDPFSCMLTYLTLGPAKLAVVRNLFRLSPPHQKVYGFLMNDFTQERWKRAASKNAFALLSQHRHEPAAAFFLLAGRLPQAIKVALMEMRDPALGLAMARLGARPGTGWLTPGAVSLPPGAPLMGPSARYSGVDNTALLREAAQALLDIKKGATAKPVTGYGGAVTSGFGTSVSTPRPTSILGFGFDDDYDSMPITKPPVAKAPSLLGDYDDDEDDDPTVYRPKGGKTGVGKAKTSSGDGGEGEAGPPTPATIFVDTRPGPTGATRYCIDTHPVEYVLQMEFLALATGECTPTPSGAGGVEREAAALRYLISSTLQKPLDATRAFVSSVLRAALPPPPLSSAAPHHHHQHQHTHFRPSDACPPPPVLRLLKHALAQPQMKNPVVVKVLLAEALAGAAAACAATHAASPSAAAPTPAELAAAMTQLEDPRLTPLLLPCLDALISAALASCLIRAGSGLAACSTVATAQQTFLDKAGRTLATFEQSESGGDSGAVKLLPYTAHVLATVRDAAGVAALQGTASSLQVCIEDYLGLQAACRTVGGWWRVPHTVYAAGATSRSGAASATSAPAFPSATATPALLLPSSLEPFARALLADADAVLPNSATSMASAFAALSSSAARSHRWASGLLTALLAGGRAVPVQPAPTAAEGEATTAADATPPVPHTETGFEEVWPLRLPLSGCRTAVLNLARTLLVASQEALVGFFKPNPLLGVHAGAQKLLVAAITQPESVPCVLPGSLAAIASINASAAEATEAVLATHARLGGAMCALIPLLIEARVHTAVLPPHGWDRLILSAWLHLLVVAVVSRDAGLLLRLLTRWMPDRVEGLPHGDSVFSPRCVAYRDTCPAFALAPGLAAACTSVKPPPGLGERRAGYDAAGWRSPGAAEGGCSSLSGNPVTSVITRLPAWELWLDDFVSLAVTCLVSTAALQSLLDRDNHPLTLQAWPVYAALNGWRQASVLRLLLGKTELSAPSAALLQPAAFLAGAPVSFPMAAARAQLDAAVAAAHPRRHILAALLGLPLTSTNPLPGFSPPSATFSSSMWWRDVDALLGCVSSSSSGLVTPPHSGGDTGSGAASTTPLAHLWSWLGGPGLLWTLGTERRALSRAVARVLSRGGIPDVRRNLRLDLLLPLQQASSGGAGAATAAATAAAGAKKASLSHPPPVRPPQPGPPLSGVLPAAIFTMTAIPPPPATSALDVPAFRALGATTALQHGELLRLLGPLLLVSAAPFGVRHIQLRARRATAGSPAASAASGGAASAGPDASVKAPKRKIMKLFDAIADTVHGAGHGGAESSGTASSPRSKEATGFAAPRVASIRLSTRDIEGFMMVESEAVPVPISLHAGAAAAPSAAAVSSGGSAPAPPAAPSPASARQSAAPAPRTYELLPEPVFMFQKPFTLPATALDHHPVLPLYVRAGPGPVLAIITLTLQEAAGGATRRATGAAGALTPDTITPIVAQHSLHSVLSWTPLPPDPPLAACLPPSFAAVVGGVDGGSSRAAPRGATTARSGTTSSSIAGSILSGFLHGGHRERDHGSHPHNGSAPTVGASEATGLGSTLVDTGVDLDEQILKTRWSPDGKSLLACFASGVVRVWDAAVPDLPCAVLSCSPRRSLAPSILPPQAPPNTCIDFPVFAVTDAVTLTTEARVIAVGTSPLFHASSPFANSAGAGAAAAGAAALASVAAATSKAVATSTAPRATTSATASPQSLQRILPAGAHLLSVFDARVSEEVPVWQDFDVSTSKIAAAIGGITALFYDDASLHLVIGTALGAVLLYDVRRCFIRSVFYWSGEGSTAATAAWAATESGCAGNSSEHEAAVLEALLKAQPRSSAASAGDAPTSAWRAVTSLVDHPSHAAVVVGWQDGGVGVLPLTMPSTAVATSALGGSGESAASLIAGLHASAWVGGVTPLAAATAPVAAQQGPPSGTIVSHGHGRGGASAASPAPRAAAAAHLCRSPWTARGGTVATAATEEFLISAGQDGGLYGLYQIY